MGRVCGSRGGSTGRRSAEDGERLIVGVGFDGGMLGIDYEV